MLVSLTLEGGMFLPWLRLLRQVFVDVISELVRRQFKSGDPSIFDLGRQQEKDQNVGELLHLQGVPSSLIAPLPLHAIQWTHAANLNGRLD